LGKSTEAYVIAAQEQALQTRLLRATVFREDVDRMCRMCGKVAESVGHLASGCSVLAGKEYRRRHDRMGLRVYWELCRANDIKCAPNWYEEVPDTVRAKADCSVEIWWDRSVQTTKALKHNRPDRCGGGGSDAEPMDAGGLCCAMGQECRGERGGEYHQIWRLGTGSKESPSRGD